MTSVAQLRRPSTDHLAAVSGAPRPLLPAALRPSRTGPAPVIQLHPVRDLAPAAEPYDTTVQPHEIVGDPGRPVGPPARGGLGSVTSSSEDAAAARISGIACSVAQGALEVLAGTRPLQQLARWLDPDNYERLQLRANLVRCISSAPGASAATQPSDSPSVRRQVVVRSARVCPVDIGVYEASVVAYDQKRVRAVALRIEQRRGQWRVTALEIG